MKKAIELFLLATILVLVSCAGLTQQQIDSISNAIGQGVTAVGQPLVSVAAPGLDAGAVTGLASAAGLIVAFGAKQLLTLFRKKNGG